VKLEKVKAELQAKTKLADSLEQQLRASVKERETLERSHKQTDTAAGASFSFFFFYSFFLPHADCDGAARVGLLCTPGACFLLVRV